MSAVKQDWCALKFASENLQKEREIVMATVNWDGDALECSSEDLQRDRNF